MAETDYHGDEREATDAIRKLFTVRNGSLLFLAFCVGTTLFSVGITLVLAEALSTRLQAAMGPLGQVFESVNAVFSGLGFIALVITFRLQHEELRLQRLELKNQHAAMTRSQGHLGRSAECDIRARHVELMKMAIDDQDLAEFWPDFQAGLSVKQTKQYNYANLVVQHQHMLYTMGAFTEADVSSFFHYLFTSEIMRSYWEARRVAREVALPPHGEELTFEQIIDATYYETRPPEPPSGPGGAGGAQVLDLDAHRQHGTEAA